MKSFRNIAVALVACYPYVLLGEVLSYPLKFVVDADAPGAVGGRLVWLDILLAIPYVLAAAPVGAIVANAVKPRGEMGWVYLFAALTVAMHIASYGGALRERSGFEGIAGLVVAGLLLVMSAVAGALFLVRRQRTEQPA